MSLVGRAEAGPLRYDDLVVGSELARVIILISSEHVTSLRRLLRLKAADAAEMPALVHVAFLRAVIAARIVPEGAILTRLRSQHRSPLEPDTEIEVQIVVGSKELKRERPWVTLSYKLATPLGDTIAIVEQSVIWPS